MGLYNCPSDEQRNAAYADAANIANKNGLISFAHGGVMIIMSPSAQRESGDEARILHNAGLGPFPERESQ